MMNLSKHPRRCLVIPALCLALGAMLPGCSAGPRNFENENDRLRKENLELRSRVDELELRVQQRIQQLQAMEQKTAATRPALQGVNLRDLPQAVSASFDRYTGPIDTNADLVDDTLRVYVKVTDQQGRFIPVTAQATLQAVAIQPGNPPAVLVDKTFTPAQVDASYRTGFTGTHYTFEAPLPTNLPAELKQITVKLTLLDASSGAKLECEQAMPIRTR